MLKFIATKRSVADIVLALMLLSQHECILSPERVAEHFAEVEVNGGLRTCPEVEHILDKESKDALKNFILAVQRQKTRQQQSSEGADRRRDVRHAMRDPSDMDAVRSVLNGVSGELYKAQIDVSPILRELIVQKHLDTDDERELLAISRFGERSLELVRKLQRRPAMAGCTFLSWLYEVEEMNLLIDQVIDSTNRKSMYPCC